MLQCGGAWPEAEKGHVLCRVSFLSVLCLGPGDIGACIYSGILQTYTLVLDMKAGADMPVFKELPVPRLGESRGSANSQLR